MKIKALAALLLAFCMMAGCAVFSVNEKSGERSTASGMAEIDVVEAAPEESFDAETALGMEAARLAVDTLTGKYGEAKGVVCILQSDPESETEKKYQNGIYEVLKEYPNITVAAEQFCEGDAEKAVTMTQDYIQKYIDMDGIIIHDARLESAVLSCLEDEGMGGVFIVSVA